MIKPPLLYKFLSAITTKLQPFLSLYFLLRYLALDSFGTYEYLLSFANLSVPLITIGMSNSYVRYIHDSTFPLSQSKQDVNFVISSSIAIPVFSLIASAVFTALIQKNYSLLSQLQPWLIFLFLASSSFSYIAFIRLRYLFEPSRLFASTVIVYILPWLLLLLLSQHFKITLFHVILGLAIVNFIPCFLTIPRLPEVSSSLYLDFYTLLRVYIPYALPLIPPIFILELSAFLPRLFLSSSDNSLSQYALLYRLSSIFLSFSFLVSYVIQPYFFRNATRLSPNFKSIWKAVFNSIFFFQSACIIPVLYLFSLYSKYVSVDSSLVLILYFCLFILAFANSLASLSGFMLDLYLSIHSVHVLTIYMISFFVGLALFLASCALNVNHLVSASLLYASPLVCSFCLLFRFSNIHISLSTPHYATLTSSFIVSLLAAPGFVPMNLHPMLVISFSLLSCYLIWKSCSFLFLSFRLQSDV